MSLSILDFRLRTIAELPDTKNIYVERLMLDAVQDLCRETHCWTEVTTDTSVSGTSTYDLTPSTSTISVIDFHEGKYNNVTLPKISNREMDQRDSQWEQRTGTPTAIIYDGDSSIRFNITPDTTGKAIELESVIMPSSVDGLIPPRIERRHTETIKYYVKWKIFEHPETFNPEMAIFFERKYMDARGKLKREVTLDGMNLEVKPRSFVTGGFSPPINMSID